MTRIGDYEVHPAADAFPLIEGDDFEELVRDIKINGLRDPITLDHTGTILIDGRNRLRACDASGVDFTVHMLSERYTEAMILDFIVSANSARRHMTAGQKAMVAVRLEPMFAAAIKEQEAERKNRRSSNITSRDPGQSSIDASQHERKATARAAHRVGASRDATERAKAVVRDAPDLAAQVAAGQVSIDAAYQQARKRIKDRPKVEKPAATPTVITLRTHDGKPVEYPKPKAKATFNASPGEGISWAAWSWNPVTGCLHGCDYCYAREIATKAGYGAAFPAGFTPLFHHERLDAPANTVLPPAHRDEAQPCTPAGCPQRRVFVCSMADLYGRWVPDEWIAQVHASCAANPQWDYLLLTKFPTRYVGLELPPTAWAGTSVDEQKRVRIAEDAFRQIDGVQVKWLSLEPLREPLTFTDLSMFDWVVIGAQTETIQPDGPVPAFAPPFEWVARIAAQAREAGCRVHMKPNLLHGPGMQLLNEYPNPRNNNTEVRDG